MSTTAPARRRVHLALALVGGVALTALTVAPAWAAGGYGPGVPTGPTSAPGGFTSVVTTQSIGTGGGTVAAGVAGGTVTVDVPAGTFAQPVEVEVTRPDLASANTSLRTLGFGGYSAVGGVGIKILTSSGQAYPGSFPRAITVSLRGSTFGPGDKVIELTGPASAVTLPATAASGVITISLSADPDLLVLAPTAAAGGTVGATSQNTGEPVAGVVVLGGLLAAAGAGITFAARRRAVAGRADH
ncbi:MAG: hypothetical protein ACYCXA_11045 [Actinomycetes bacterium]